MTRETYKTRKIIIREEKGRNKGFHGVYINGQLVTLSAKDLGSLMEQARRDIDAVELRPHAYADYWQAA